MANDTPCGSKDRTPLYNGHCISHVDIQIETLDAELKLLEVLDLDNYFFQTPNRIKPNSQREHRPWCLLLPIHSSWKPCWDVVYNLLHDQLVCDKLRQKMWSLLCVVQPDESVIGQRHTNLQCSIMPPLMPRTCKVDHVQRSSCIEGKWSGHIV